MNENALNAKASKTPREYWFNVKKNWQLYLLLLPVALWFLIWAYKPMLGLIIAFKDYDAAYGMFGSDFVGFDNFVTLIAGGQSNQFWQAFRNTFVNSAYGLCFGFPLPIFLALLFSEIKNKKYRSVLQVCSYLPKFISTVVITTIIFIKAGNTGEWVWVTRCSPVRSTTGTVV